MKIETIYNQLGNNINDAFTPPEYSIANSFIISQFTFAELQDILIKTKIHQIKRVKIENAFLDLEKGVVDRFKTDHWVNKQIYKLEFLKIKNKQL